MLTVTLRKQCYPTVNRYIIVFSKISYSDSAVVKVNQTLKIKEFGDDFNSETVKKPQFKKNFIQDLFINKFHEKILEYPELNCLKQVESLKQQSYLAQQLLCDTKDKFKALCKRDFENSVSALRTHELTGFKLPRGQKGFGYVNSEFSYMQEALGLIPALSKSVAENDNFGAHLISEHGSNSQKEMYLRKLASGEIVASFAHSESEPFAILDPDLVNTTAELSSDGKNYIISGQKSWVYNAKHADIFILSANTTTVNSDGVQEKKPTLFLVPKDSPGLKIHECINTEALKHMSICDISLNEVVVPLSSVLGDVQAGGNIVRKILAHGKLSNGAHCLPIMRELVNMAINHCIHNKFFKQPKHERDYYKIKIAELVSQVYAVESATYLMTGRLDEFLNADIFLESLIVKILASENLRSVLQKCIELVGQELILSDCSWKQIVRDSYFFSASDITNDHLRLVLSITGLQYAMDHRGKKFNIGRKVSDMFHGVKKLLPSDRDETLITKGVLAWYVHCIFENESKALEDGVSWLYQSSSDLIRSHGENVFDMYWELKNLADIVIFVYAETAVLGRASRAYCLGVERFEGDRCIASALMKVYHHRINKLGRLLKYRHRRPRIEKVEEKIMNSNSYSELVSVFKNLKLQNQNK